MPHNEANFGIGTLAINELASGLLILTFAKVPGPRRDANVGIGPLAVERLRCYQFAHPKRRLGKGERTPAARSRKRSEEFKRSRVLHCRPQIGLFGGEPWHEQRHGHGLRLVSMVTIGAAIRPMC